MIENELREKVIKGLECCAAMSGDKCRECSYSKECLDTDLPYGMPHLAADALALLKAQEPVKPVMHYVPDGKRSSAAWQCGNCLIDIGYGVNYCYNCGQAVKWE